MAAEDIVTTAHPAQARDLTYGVFASDGCEITPLDEFSAQVERGSVALTAMFGAFVGKSRQHLKYTVRVFAAPEGGSVVRLERANSGAMAGAIGVARARTVFTEWHGRVAAALPR
ncbi:hypothetical protein GCM10023221_16750 [Luteimicrobium xylanilyticum]|uniref:Uncharacterized protein n=1 Tax=Luteimicrobium xylanilyticum TaxID=1133546 RepID=A0A5P9QEX8_9MICO|nr:hypothetical protein [Luteimicrobium xylanilyticum]QFU99957.1 hypothetical protein KDY119_03493 [Luteimicrobium xylanilyticum]